MIARLKIPFITRVFANKISFGEGEQASLGMPYPVSTHHFESLPSLCYQNMTYQPSYMVQGLLHPKNSANEHWTSESYFEKWSFLKIAIIKV